MKLRGVIFSVLLCSAACVCAMSSDTLLYHIPVKKEMSVYEQRVEKRMNRWQRMIPSHYKAQFAGSIGVASLGLGWTYGKNDQWETDVMLGYLPKFESSEGKAIFCLKESFIPWKIYIAQSGFTFKPFTCGLFLSSVLNNEFWLNEPSRYPNGYYGFSTRIRANIFIGQRFTFYSPESKRTHAKGVSVYYELSACDTDLCTFFGDRCIKFKDIMSLALGLKLHL